MATRLHQLNKMHIVTLLLLTLITLLLLHKQKREATHHHHLNNTIAMLPLQHKTTRMPLHQFKIKSIVMPLLLFNR